MTAIADDARAVDPIAYIRAIGLRPEDSYGFLPLDVHDRSSFFFLYRERPEYAVAREQLPAAESITNIDIGVTGFQFGGGRQPDIDVAAAMPGGKTGDLIAQAMAMQQAYQGMPGAPPPETEASRLAQVEGLRAAGILPDELHETAIYGVQGGHAGPNPGGVPAAAAAPDAPPIAIHRMYPRLHKRSLTDQFDDYLPSYRDALRLCPEDVYGVFPRHTFTTHADTGDVTGWEDYWLVYRDRPEYERGRAAWADGMTEPGGFAERLFARMKKQAWPDAEIVPGVAPASTAVFDDRQVSTQKDRWPREPIQTRKRGAEFADALRDKIVGFGYAPEDSFGMCPDFNSNAISFAWR